MFELPVEPDAKIIAAALRRIDAMDEAVKLMPEGIKRDLMASIIRDLRTLLSNKDAPPGPEFYALVHNLSVGWGLN